ncbi:MAG: hypothetical protein QNJ90_04595 [Planctomycetota bacterium]|nr:hypothetical protein [Planctomycetota bacterium]
MSHRSKLWIPVLLTGFMLSPLVEKAEAAWVGRDWLSVNASNVFRVTGTVYFDIDDPTTGRWEVVLEWHGMDNSHSDVLRYDTFPLVRNGSLQQSFAYSVANTGRWANEDKDRLFNKRRDEIRCLILIRHNGVYQRHEELTNQVTGYF